MNHVHEVLRLLEALQLALHGHHNQHVLLRHVLPDIRSLQKLLHAARMHSRMHALEAQHPAVAE